MDLLAKDKLARLDEERQRRRKERADEAVRRLAEIGKQTLQSAQAPSAGAADADAQQPGRLSRVLFEQAVGRAKPSRGKRGKYDDDARVLAQNSAQQAIGQLSQAMRTIHGAVVDASGAGLQGGLEQAARSVTDVVHRVSQVSQGNTAGMESARGNPLADLMADEAADSSAQERSNALDQTPEADREHHAPDPALAASVAGALGGGHGHAGLGGLVHDVARTGEDIVARGAAAPDVQARLGASGLGSLATAAGNLGLGHIDAAGAAGALPGIASAVTTVIHNPTVQRIADTATNAVEAGQDIAKLPGEIKDARNATSPLAGIASAAGAISSTAGAIGGTASAVTAAIGAPDKAAKAILGVTEPIGKVADVVSAGAGAAERAGKDPRGAAEGAFGGALAGAATAALGGRGGSVLGKIASTVEGHVPNADARNVLAGAAAGAGASDSKAIGQAAAQGALAGAGAKPDAAAAPTATATPGAPATGAAPGAAASAGATPTAAGAAAPVRAGATSTEHARTTAPAGHAAPAHAAHAAGHAAPAHAAHAAAHAAPHAGHAAHAGGAAPHAHTAAPAAHASAGQAPASSTPRTGGTPPAPGSSTPAHSRVSAEDRQRAVAPSQAPASGRNAAPVNVAAGGAMQVAPQSVATPDPQIDPKQKEITQPSFQISAKGDSAALPQIPSDLATAPAPTIAAPAPTATQPGAIPSTAPPAQRQTAPLAPVAATPAAAPNPALAAARGAVSGIQLPTGTVTPLPASAQPAAASASPAPGPAAHPGASAVATAAPPAVAPPAASLPPAQLKPSVAAPQTQSAQPPAPTVPAVRNPGGNEPPNPSSLVQATVSLSGDRTAAQSAITAEAQTQTRVAPEARAQQQAELAPLAPQLATTQRSADAPTQQANASASAQSAQAAAAGRAQEQSQVASGDAQIQSQAQAAAAERAQLAATPPPAILAQTSAAAMQPHAQQATAAIASAAAAVAAGAVAVNPAAIARGAQAAQTPAQLPPFDGSRFAALDQRAPLPPVSTAAVDAASQQAAATYQQATAQGQQLANIPAPQIQAPVGAGAGAKTKGGQPSREAAIANIEQQVAAQTQAQAPAQMQAAAAPLQSEIQQKVTAAQTAAQQSGQQQLAAGQQQAQQIAQTAPPTTGAQAAQTAQAEYATHQQTATAAQATMQASIAGASSTAAASAAAARAARDAAATGASAQYQQQVSGQILPGYQAAQTAAATAQTAAAATAQAQMTTEQAQAQAAATQATAQAKAKADADLASHQAQLDQQRTSAIASHQQQIAAANAQHQAQMQQAQTQANAQIQQHQTEMASQVTQQQTQGQQEVSQHLQEGEQQYQQQIQQGTQQADAERAKAEQQAAAKKQQAADEKAKHSGGIIGGVVDWVEARVNDLLDAAKAVLSAARDLVVSIMEKARQVAMAALEKARQAALSALNKVKGAIQGIISAAAAAIRSVISAAAQMIRNVIQNLANALKSLVAALTTMLTTLVQAFQLAMNALLDGLIAAVSLVNKDLGDKLKTATQKYRDAFNKTLDKLQSDIQAAGAAMQQQIQAAADQAIAVVNAAETTLNAAVTAVETTLNSAVEAAYQLGASAINAAFDAAEYAVNKAFDVAEAGIKAYFDAQIAGLSLIQKGVDMVATFYKDMADKVLTAIDAVAQAIVAAIPDSIVKGFVDFWNGPWRTTIIIGLATIAAVAITAATLGTGAPVAAILLAGVIGGTIGGTAYFGGEMLAREGEIKESKGGKMYIPGFGESEIKMGPDGKPVPPPNLTPEQMQDWEDKAKWAMSNFNVQGGQNGQAATFDRKSGAEIGNYAVQEGVKGFGEGFVSGSMAMAGSVAGAAVKGAPLLAKLVTNPATRELISTGVTNVLTGPVQSAMTDAWDKGFDALKDGKSPGEAFAEAWKGAKKDLTSPSGWISAALMTGASPLKSKMFGKAFESAVEQKVTNKLGQVVVKEGAGIAFDSASQTIGTAGGAFVQAYQEAVAKGKSPAEALEAARKAGGDAFKPENLVNTVLMNTASAGSNHYAEGVYKAREEAANPHPTTGAEGDHPTANQAHTSEAETHNVDPAAHPDATTQADPAARTTQPDPATASTAQSRPTETQAHPDQTGTHAPGETHAQTETPQGTRASTPEPAERTAATERTPTTAADPALAHGEPRVAEPSVREQIDRVTGVDKGPEHEAAMQQLRDFYAQQAREAENPLQVKGTASDGPYGWEFGHTVTEFSHGVSQVEYRVHLDGDTHGISPADLAALKERVVAGIDQHYNNGQTITNSKGDPSRLHVEVVFVTDPAQAHTSVEVHPGDGPANLNHWYVDGQPTTHAHEAGHGMFGFKDEYRDSTVPNRATETSPGVAHDGSLMGNYWGPDGKPMPGTGLQQRHLDEIGALHQAQAGDPALAGAPAPAPRDTAPVREPNAPERTVAELEPKLAEIERAGETNPHLAPEAVENARAARAEIARLREERAQVQAGEGAASALTPDQRANKLKLIDEQMQQVAQSAVDRYNREGAKPQTDSETLKQIEARTPEQVAARTEEIRQAREAITARDKALADRLHSETVTGADGKQHVQQVFDHVTFGNGFAGIANETSRPNRGPNDLVIGGKNPWDGATSKFGQGAGDSEVPNHKPGHGMTETNTDPQRRFMLASEHADNVALAKNDHNIGAYDGTSGPIERGPGADWPAFAKDGGATQRMAVTGPDGKTRYIYAKSADIAAGPGPNRALEPHVLDPEVMKEMMRDKAFAYGDQAFGADSVRPGEVANYGAGAAGAWGSEAAASKLKSDGSRASEVEWIGREPTVRDQDTQAQKDKLAGLQRDVQTAKTSGDPAKIAEAQAALTKFTFEEAARNGNLPRNQQEGAAFHEKMQAENGGNISRRVTKSIAKVEYVPEVENGPKRVKITLEDIGPDGKPVVLWKDSLVVSIGQDPTAKGGPIDLAQAYKGDMHPIYGPKDASGFAPIVGLESTDKSVRILGAAMTPDKVAPAMLKGATDTSTEAFKQNLKTQATAPDVNADSHGVVQGFVLAQKTIEGANNVRKAELLAMTPHDQRVAMEQMGGHAPPNAPAAPEPTAGPESATPKPPEGMPWRTTPVITPPPSAPASASPIAAPAAVAAAPQPSDTTDPSDTVTPTELSAPPAPSTAPPATTPSTPASTTVAPAATPAVHATPAAPTTAPPTATAPAAAAPAFGHDAHGRKASLLAPFFGEMTSVAQQLAPQFTPLGLHFRPQILLATAMQEAANRAPLTNRSFDNGLGIMQVTPYRGRLDATVAQAIGWDNSRDVEYNIAHSRWRQAGANLLAGAATMLAKAKAIKHAVGTIWEQMDESHRWRAVMFAYNAGEGAAIRALRTGGANAPMVSSFTNPQGHRVSHDYTAELGARLQYVESHSPFGHHEAEGATPATSAPTAAPTSHAPAPTEAEPPTSAAPPPPTHAPAPTHAPTTAPATTTAPAAAPAAGATPTFGHDAHGRKASLLAPFFHEMVTIAQQLAPQFTPLGLHFRPQILLATAMQEAANRAPLTNRSFDNGLGIMQVTPYHGRLDATVAQAIGWDNSRDIEYNIAHSRWREAGANLLAGAATMLAKAKAIKRGVQAIWEQMDESHRWRAVMFAYNAGEGAAIRALRTGGPNAPMVSSFTNPQGHRVSHDYTAELGARLEYVENHIPFLHHDGATPAPAAATGAPTTQGPAPAAHAPAPAPAHDAASPTSAAPTARHAPATEPAGQAAPAHEAPHATYDAIARNFQTAIPGSSLTWHQALYLPSWGRYARPSDFTNVSIDTVLDNIQRQAAALQRVAAHFGKSIVVHCWVRPPAYNKQIGGAGNSAHLRGTATDFHMPGITAEAARQVLRGDPTLYHGAGENGVSWIHLDLEHHSWFHP